MLTGRPNLNHWSRIYTCKSMPRGLLRSHSEPVLRTRGFLKLMLLYAKLWRSGPGHLEGPAWLAPLSIFEIHSSMVSRTITCTLTLRLCHLLQTFTIVFCGTRASFRKLSPDNSCSNPPRSVPCSCAPAWHTILFIWFVFVFITHLWVKFAKVW
jgi:hypothetical protein